MKRKNTRILRYFPAENSAKLLIKIAPHDVGMFRFLLEAHENLAYFTVLEKKTALLKLVFAAPSRKKVLETLEKIKADIPLCWQPWPTEKREQCIEYEIITRKKA